SAAPPRTDRSGRASSTDGPSIAPPAALSCPRPARQSHRHPPVSSDAQGPPDHHSSPTLSRCHPPTARCMKNVCHKSKEPPVSVTKITKINSCSEEFLRVLRFTSCLRGSVRAAMKP